HPLSFNTHPLPSSLPISSFHCSRDHRDLHSFPTRRSSDLFWRIEEAAELVTQAEQRLVLTADGEATLRLLKRADALLSKELHSSVLPLREQLLEGIAAMETFVGQDFTGHWLKLKNWEKHSQTLPFLSHEKKEEILEGEASNHGWRRLESHRQVKFRKPKTEFDLH